MDTYGYDANGVPNANGLTPGVDNRVSTDGLWTYTYDDAGELVEKSQGSGSPTWWYGYDFHGNMTSAKYSATDGTPTVVIDYQYDAFDNLVGRTETDSGTVVSDVRYVVDGWDTAKPGPTGNENFDDYADLVSNGSGGWNVGTWRMFSTGFDQPVASVTSAGAVSWYASDRHGSVDAIFDTSGMTIEQRGFDPFGNLVSGNMTDRFGFQGGQTDAATSLTHFAARWYDAATQQWTSEDPLGLQPGPNQRAFAENAPTDATDPSGRYIVASNIKQASAMAQYIYAISGTKVNAPRPIGDGRYVIDTLDPKDVKKGWDGKSWNTGASSIEEQKRRDLIMASISHGSGSNVMISDDSMQLAPVNNNIYVPIPKPGEKQSLSDDYFRKASVAFGPTGDFLAHLVISHRFVRRQAT